MEFDTAENESSIQIPFIQLQDSAIICPLEDAENSLPQTKTRFVPVTSEDVDKLINDEENLNTKRKTVYDINIVKKFQYGLLLSVCLFYLDGEFSKVVYCPFNSTWHRLYFKLGRKV